jgi:lipopolysaccharide biosynthesis protein
MRVRIDKARHHDAVAGVDHFTVRVNQAFDFAASTDGFDELATHEHRAVFDDRELTQITARSRASRAREGY